MSRGSLYTSVIVGMALLITPLPAAAQGDFNAESPLANDGPLVELLLSESWTREAVALRLLQAVEVAGFQPEPCLPGEEMFDDVPATSPFCSWIEELALRGITSGCSATTYCPHSAVSRSQMAVFLVRAIEAAIAAVPEGPTGPPGPQGETGPPGSLPAGAVMFFALDDCPEGWIEHVGARGRTIVGLPSGGSLEGTRGSALGNLENRTHSHSVNLPSFPTIANDAPHSHSVPGHNHRWYVEGMSFLEVGAPPIPVTPFPVAAGGTIFHLLHSDATYFTDISPTDQTGSSTSTAHNHTVNPPTVSSSSRGTSDVIPYIQLLACVKT